VRQFDPVTDQVLPEAAALCSLIIQAALARFPNDPTILMVYANYIIHVKKEPRAARQQLQLASKGEPGIIDRYNIFAAQVSTH
jgi:predicted Zn-dependent protease